MSFSDLNDLAEHQDISCDICIVGAGAAGITLAKTLNNKNINVILLESGGTEYEQETQSLYNGSSIGRNYFNLSYDRLRYFGGATNHWGGWCTPFTREDFFEHDWIENSGWPITKDELDPHYQRAQKICEIAAYKYLEKDWAGTRDIDFKQFDDNKIISRIWQHSDVRFGSTYSDELRQSNNVNVIFHANALEIVTDENEKHVKHITVSTLSNKRATISASRFVVACGGLETPRLLLLSKHVNPQGIANQNDLVGRYFMDHLEGPSARVFFNDSENSGNQDWFRRFSHKRKIAGTQMTSGLCTSYEARKKHRILHHSTTIEADLDYQSGYFSFKRLLQGESSSVYDDSINALSDIDEIFKWLYHRLNETTYYPPLTQQKSFKLFSRTEVEPNYHSRLTLGDEKDHFGQQRIVLDWKLTPLAKQTILKSNTVLAEEFGRLGLGRIKLDDWLYDDTPEIPIGPGHHHMGTTRMHSDPAKGVVDKNCKVHGIDNLYISSSSVYPTSSYVNPTLTIVALAIRLAEHLQDKTLS